MNRPNASVVVLLTMPPVARGDADLRGLERLAVRRIGDDTGQIGIRRGTSALGRARGACPRGMASSASKMK